MKNWKKLLCILLTMVMVLGLVPFSAFAKTSEESPEQPAYEFYVPMGTSISAGYGLPDARYGATTGNGVFDSKYTYARLLKDEFNIADGYSGPLLGTRTLEYRMLLEEDYNEKDDYNEFWVEKNCQNGLEQLKQKAPVYKENLAKADLITFEIGLNDITSYAMCSIMTELEERATEEGNQTVVEMVEAIAAESMGTAEGMLDLATLASQFYDTEMGQIVEKMFQYFQEGMRSFQDNFPLVIDDIRRINPDADMFVLGCYNPLEHLLTTDEHIENENGNADIRELIMGSGQYLQLTDEQVVYIFSLMQEFVVGMQNLAMKNYASTGNYTYVDTLGIDLTGSIDATHPGVKGHVYLFEHLATAIYGLYPCQHRHVTTRNVIVPTETRTGRTGDIVCADCGTTLKEGQEISYADYQKLVDTEEVPPAADEEDPINPAPKGEPKKHDGYDVLSFTSDVHNKSGDVSANRLSDWIDSVQTEIGTIDFFGECGDIADGTNAASGDTYWALVQKVIDVIKNSTIKNWVFTTGNHEQEHGDYNNTTNATKNSVTMIGEAEVPSDANYKVYCFGATQKENLFLESEITNLDNYLAKVPADCPVFILSHYPLHDEGSRKIENKDKVIEVLNKYPNAIFLWGHDHTDAAGSNEYHYDNVFTDHIDGTEIKFTYAAAGCMSDSEYSSGSAAVKGKGLVVTVEDGRINDGKIPEVTMQYVDASAGTISENYEIDITGPDDEKIVENCNAIPGSYAYEQIETLEPGEYIIAFKNGENYVGLDLTKCYGYTNGSSYRYSGYKGTKVTVTDNKVTGGVTSDMVWKIESNNGKLTIKNMLTGKYLNAGYVDNGIKSGSKDGKIYLANTQDTWTLSGSQLTSTAAGKKLAYDQSDNGDISTPYSGSADFFTVRSTGDDMVFFKVTGSPVAEGKPEEDPPEETAKDLGGKYFVIAYETRAMGTTESEGCTATEETTFWQSTIKTEHTYSGLNGRDVKFTDTKNIDAASLAKDILWLFEKVGDNEYRIKSVHNDLYLGSQYTASSSSFWMASGEKAELFLTADPNYTWVYSGSALTCKQSNAKLSFMVTKDDLPGTVEGATHFFTVRNNDVKIKLYEVKNVASVQDPSVEQLLGKCRDWQRRGIGEGKFCLVVNDYAIGMPNGGRTFETKKIANASELKALGENFQWNVVNTGDGYTFENVGRPGNYLGAYTTVDLFEAGASPAINLAPYVWQFSNNHLCTTVEARGLLDVRIPYTFNLSCTDDGVSLSTNNIFSGITDMSQFTEIFGGEGGGLAGLIEQSNREIVTIYDTVKLYQWAKTDAEHHVTEKSRTPSTEFEVGKIVYECENCGASYVKIIPKKDHPVCTYDQQVAEEEYLVSGATCTAPAVYYMSCKCGEKGTETFEYGEALGHDIRQWTPVEEEGNEHLHQGECSRCHETFTEEHVYDRQESSSWWSRPNEKYQATPATCDEPAQYYWHCECGAIDYEKETYAVGNPLGHAWGDWEKVDEEVHQHTCTRDDTHTETKPHNWDEGVTDETTGIKTYTCQDCGATKTESIETEDYLYGDADNNGKIDVSDALAVLRDVVNLEKLSGKALIQADVDGNGEVDVTDALNILRKIVNLITKFPIEETEDNIAA